MKISTKIIYAIKAIVDLSLSKENSFISIRDISNRQSISVKYLENIMAQLKSNDIVRSIKGSRGGYKLARPPEELTLYDIFSTFESRNMFNGNYGMLKKNNDIVSLGVAEILGRADNAYFRILKSISLADVVKSVEMKMSSEHMMYYI